MVCIWINYEGSNNSAKGGSKDFQIKIYIYLMKAFNWLYFNYVKNVKKLMMFM